MKLTRIVHFILPLFLLLTTAILVFVILRIRHLSLPISQTLATFALILPTSAVASLQGIRFLLSKSWKNGTISLNLPLFTLIVTQIIYETIIATLSLVYIFPESAVNCALNERWQELFINKDEKAVRAIQDKFNCCGLKTVKDRAWPFRSDQASSCALTYGRSQSCLTPWRTSEKKNASLIFLVVIVVFIAKVSAIIIFFTKNTKIKHQLITFEGEDPEEAQRSNFGRLLIKDNNSKNAFKDDETEHIPPENQSSNSVDQNNEISPLLPEVRNEWIAESSNRGT